MAFSMDVTYAGVSYWLIASEQITQLNAVTLGGEETMCDLLQGVETVNALLDSPKNFFQRIFNF